VGHQLPSGDLRWLPRLSLLTLSRAAYLLCLAALALAASSCRYRGDVVGPSAHVIYLISDGFHSSLVVPSSFDARANGLVEWAPYIELGFSDHAWTVDGDESWHHAIRLGLIPDTGAVEVGPVYDLATLLEAPELEEPIAIPISAAGWQALGERLAFWVELDSDVIAVVDGRSYLASTQRFSAYNSCNDFCADLLKSAGVGIRPSPWRTQAALRREVARWVAEQDVDWKTVPLAPLRHR
jgi:hypothetical protein